MSDVPGFDKLYMRDSGLAFENAIFFGMRKPDEYMYMYTDGVFDFFKHCDTRQYVCYRYKGVLWMFLHVIGLLLQVRMPKQTIPDNFTTKGKKRLVFRK